MIYTIKDKNYHFKTLFDTKTGLYLRSGILNEEGIDTGIDPFMASYPHLIDVGIMGHCIHGKTGLCKKAGVECYQNGMLTEMENMSVEDFRLIAKQSKDRCNQIALGGRGDPDQHEHFEEILQICKQNHLVPNFTTSGYGMTEELAKLCKKYCGAVAVSWYRSDYTLKAIDFLLHAGVKTNIHYVVGKNTIDEALERLKTNDFPIGVNAVVFLLHKPVGQGRLENVLSLEDERVRLFFEELENEHPFKVGVDSCSIPGVIQFGTTSLNCVDTCEGARFSCYISSDMKMVPCSFDQVLDYGVSLRECSEEDSFWYFEKQKEREEELKQALSRTLSEEQMKKLVVYWILSVGISVKDRKRWETEEWNEEDKEFSMEEYNALLCEFFLDGWSWEREALYEFYLEKYTAESERMQHYAEKFVGFKERDMIKYIFGVEKVFYWDCEVGTVEAVNVLKELGYCKYACGHMG